MFKDILFAGGGFVFGAFCPGVLRKIKAYFVKESTAVKTSPVVTSALGKAETTVSSISKKL
jgi:hypothetical protein